MQPFRSLVYRNGNTPGSAHRPGAAGNQGAARALAPPSRLSKGAEMAGWIWLHTRGGSGRAG